MNFQLKKLRACAVYPVTQTSMSAGYDLHAAIEEPVVIEPNRTAILIPTGFALCINERSIAAMLFPRSGHGHKHGLMLGTTIGLIDADYQDEIFISATLRPGYPTYTIQPGERIAQLVFTTVNHPEYFNIVDEFTGINSSRKGGFGSTN